MVVGAIAIMVMTHAAGCTSPTEAAGGQPSATPPTTGAATEAREPSRTEYAELFEDYSRNMVRCLTDKGWNVVEHDDGTFGTGPEGIPNEQVDRYDADREECLARFGYDLPPPSYSQQEAEELYDALVEVAGCMRDLGYDVADPPSREAFVADLLERPIPPWHPHDTLFEGSAGEAELERVMDTCPVP